MIKRLNITEDVIKVIPMLFLQQDGDDVVFYSRKWLFGGTHVLEDIAMCLGISDHYIKGTEDDADGRAFNEEDTERMLKLNEYISENLFYLESLIHQYIVKGGITVGTYKAKDNELIWEKES